MNTKNVEELVLQSLEHEQGGVKVYAAAVKAAVDPRLKKEWTKYLEETRRHVTVLEGVCKALSIDARRETPGRKIVRGLGGALLGAIEQALAAGDPAMAQIVAAECVVQAETKDHLDWTLLGKVAEGMTGPGAKTLMDAYREIEDQEDEHLYHTKGWCRELWVEALGIPAVLPPPEERRKVKTAMGAAKAEQEAEKARGARLPELRAGKKGRAVPAAGEATAPRRAR